MTTQQTQDQVNRHLSFLAQDENNLTLLVKISDLYVELGNLDAAQEHLNKANAINRIACLGHQGLLHLHQNQFRQAKQCFIEALDHEDTLALRYNLGLAHFLDSDLKNATNVLSPILAEAHHPEAQLLMARILYGQEEPHKALDLLDELLTHQADDPEALGLLALVYFDMDEGELAMDTSNQALALNPNNYDAKLVNVMSRLTTQETSIEEIEALLQINPDDCRLWFALGTVHMSQGTLDLAEYNLKKALEIYPEFYDCSIALGWCLLLKNQLDEALITYQQATRTVPDLADSWGGLALISALKEDFLEAEQLIQKTKKLNSECFLAEIAEVIYFNHKNPLKANKQLINALKNSKVPVSEKLAFIIEHMHGSVHVH